MFASGSFVAFLLVALLLGTDTESSDLGLPDLVSSSFDSDFAESASGMGVSEMSLESDRGALAEVLSFSAAGLPSRPVSGIADGSNGAYIRQMI
jgi:hypothetical protein